MRQRKTAANQVAGKVDQVRRQGLEYDLRRRIIQTHLSNSVFCRVIPFKIGQNSFGQRRTAKKIDEQLDAHQKKKEEQKTAPKKKEQKAPKKKEQKAPEKEEQKAPGKRRKSSDELYNEFKQREEKILNEIRAEALIKAKAELEAVKAELEAAKAEKAEAEKAEAKKAEAKKAEAKKVEAKKVEAKKVEAKKVEVEAEKAEAKAEAAKVVAKTTSLKLFGYTVFEYSR